MEGTAFVALAASIVSLAAFALLAVMFWRGSWLFLLAGRAGRKQEGDSGFRELGRRMAVVMAACAALMATLAAFLGTTIAGQAAIASAAAAVSNAALLVLVATVMWLLIANRPKAEGPREGDGADPAAMAERIRRSSFGHLRPATVLFLIAALAVTVGVGVLAAL